MTTDINVFKSKTADFIYTKKSMKTNQQNKQKAEVGKRITRNTVAIEASAIACTVSVDKDSFGFTGRTSFLFVLSTERFTRQWMVRGARFQPGNGVTPPDTVEGSFDG